jgi:hypothetical protein
MTTHAYTLTFADGKQCTCIDPERLPFDELERGLKAVFKPGYLISIISGNKPEPEQSK